jgi:hypothetical protein
MILCFVVMNWVKSNNKRKQTKQTCLLLFVGLHYNKKINLLLTKLRYSEKKKKKNNHHFWCNKNKIKRWRANHIVFILFADAIGACHPPLHGVALRGRKKQRCTQHVVVIIVLFAKLHNSKKKKQSPTRCCHCPLCKVVL